MLAFSFLKLSTFFNKYLYIIVGLIALTILAVVLPNASSIAEKFGVETRATLKANLAKEEVKTQTAVKANTELVKEIKEEKASTEVTLKVIEDLSTVKTNTAVKVSEIKVKKAKKIAKVAKIDVSETTAASSITVPTNNPYTPEIVQGVATANIDAIWETYEEIRGV